MADMQTCWAYQEGRCRRGKRCPYAHVEDPEFKRSACQDFARGRCRKGDACPSSHDPEDIASLKVEPADVTGAFEVKSPPRPSHQRPTCHQFARGMCQRGESCKYSHDADDTAALNSGPPDPFCEIEQSEKAATQAAFREWRYGIPKDLKKAGKLGTQMGRFCQVASKLTMSGTEVMQEVIELLASEGGMLRIVELFDQNFESLSDSQLGRIFKQQLLPFFQAISNTTVRSSALMESRLARICQYIYGPSGQRALQLFQAVVRHLSTLHLLSSDHDGSIDVAAIPAFEYSLGVFALVVQVNTSAQAHEGLVPIVETLANLLEWILIERPAFDLRNTRKHLMTLCTRFGIGAVAPNTHAAMKSRGVLATFELEKELPGSLSPNGIRHDNDHEDIRQISILPTLAEIQSPRSEYLPTVDPQDWHIPGLPGLLDRHFRLLREGTVGQLRDAAKFDLERLQNPDRHAEVRLKRQGARTYVYNNLRVSDIAFDVHDGLELALSFDQPAHLSNKSEHIRKEWWEGAKRMTREALICLLSSEGSATFLIVAPSPMGAEVKDARLKATRGRLQKEDNLYNDPERAIVVARLVNNEDIRSVMDAVLGNNTAQFALVEFPGVVLPAFKPTLEAMQRLSTSLDIPFKDVLAPTAPSEDLNAAVEVPPPLYSMKPGFNFDLSCLAADGAVLHLDPGEQLHETMNQLRLNSSLDDGQAEALVSSLSRSLALIQGPPGTGKSFTGVEILRALLANKSSIENAPILCVTFTNHALDSGLLRLLDLGVQQMIRIGSRSKSERLTPINLRTVAQRQPMTNIERQNKRELTKTAEGETTEINQIMSDLGRLNRYDEAQLKSFLEMYYGSHHEQWFDEVVDGDGFTSTSHHPGFTLSHWLRSGRDVATSPRSIEELQEVNVNDMTSSERRKLQAAWFMELKDQLLDRLATALDSYRDVKAKLDLIKTEADLRVLRQANIIGVTTSGLARNIDLLSRVNIKVMVCEEAGEVLEAHALTALLPSIEHAILIGDHEQLRPRTESHQLSTESREGAQYALDVSLFERLVQPKNILARPLPLSTLGVQRRMHPSISQLIRRTIYPALIDASPVSEYPEVAGMKRRLFWMHHPNDEDGRGDLQSTSYTNAFEVEMTAALVSHLVKQGVYAAGDIAVLTPYLGQLGKIRKKLANTFEILINDRDQDDLAKEGEEDTGTAESSERPEVSRGTLLSALRVATVDNFQGEEAKVVIISLVRSNPKDNPGFLRTTNRINVLLSRAKHGMYIIGNAETMRTAEMWSDVIDILEEDGLVGDSLDLACARHPETALPVSKPDDFVLTSPEGGCSQMCELPLQCGHQCSSACHSDSQHRAVFCMNQCDRFMPCGQHKCPMRCGESPCPTLCEELVLVKDWSPPGCEHVITSVPCHQYKNPSTIVCRTPVKKTVEACGHVVEVPCHVDVADKGFKCTTVCGAARDDCDHHCLNLCHECHTMKRDEDGDIALEVDHGRCKSKCGKAYIGCHHEDTGDCHGTESCPPCRSACDTKCLHATCNRPCWAPCLPCVSPECGVTGCESAGCCSTPCDNVPVSRRCEKTLTCGCQCPSVTGEKCPGQDFCQKHGHDTNLSQLADHIDGEEYADVNLDKDPCIFTSCGHIFTIKSLDSRLGLSQHYDVDPVTGDYTKAKTSAEPFSSDGAKLCPACRGPLQGITRYGRIVKRALLDKNAKKFIAWSDKEHLELFKRVAAEKERLLNDVDSVRKANQDVRISGPLKDQMTAVSRLKTSGRYHGAFEIFQNIEEFLHKLREDESLCSKFKDLVEAAKRKKQQSGTEHLEPYFPEPQFREHLQGLCLLIRGEMAIFQDIVNMHVKTAASDRKGALIVNFEANRERCEFLIKAAIEVVSVRQEVEGRIFWSRYAAVELGSVKGAVDQKKPTTAEKMENLKAAALTHLDRAEEVRARLPDSTEDLRDEIVEVKRMLDESSPASEMRMVIAQTVKEVASVTDKWHMCSNAHPFSVERGSPKQLARCHVCGAGVFVPEPVLEKAVTNGTSDGHTNGMAEVDDLAERFGKLRALKG